MERLEIPDNPRQPMDCHAGECPQPDGAGIRLPDVPGQGLQGGILLQNGLHSGKQQLSRLGQLDAAAAAA